MTTVLEGNPPLIERVWGAPLIVHGRVLKRVESSVDRSGDDMITKAIYPLKGEPEHQLQVVSVYQLKIEELLKGDLDDMVIEVRLVGGEKEDFKTDWSVRLEEETRVVLMLSPDYGPNQVSSRFVPYFSTCFLVTNRGEVKLDAESVKELKTQKIPVSKSSLKLEKLRDMIQSEVKKQTEEEKKIESAEDKEMSDIRKTSYGEVGEMPQPALGEARYSHPEADS
jgi:hypothetical protein